MNSKAGEEIDHARRELVVRSRQMIADGLGIGSCGNLSVRIGDIVAITPSVVEYDVMSEDDICLVGIDGKVLLEGANRPRRCRCTSPSTTRARHAPWSTRTRRR